MPEQDRAKRLYYDDPYLVEFEARVAAATPVHQAGGHTAYAVVLDRTAFYPESGGQPCDTGDIQGLPVLSVTEERGDVVHLVGCTAARAPACDQSGTPAAERPALLVPGEVVKCRVDFQRRFDHMQQHLGQHILSSAFEKTLDADTVGFHLGSTYVTIDLDVDSLQDRGAEQAEDLANRIVFENRSVTAAWYSRDEALGLPLRKRPEREGPLRIIEVEGFDYSPCGGTHPRRTGEVGLIKIVRWERARSGVRVYFACGNRALREFRWRNALLNSVARSLSVAPGELDAAVARLVQQAQALSREVERLSSELLSREAEALLREPDAPAGPGRPLVVARVLGGRSFDEARILAARITSACAAVALFATPSQDGVRVVFSCSSDVDADMGRLMKDVMSALGGKGGGTSKVAQGGVKAQSEAGGPESVARRILDVATARLLRS